VLGNALASVVIAKWEGVFGEVEQPAAAETPPSP
jgi:Na+/H+-dicarboxylate symporter